MIEFCLVGSGAVRANPKRGGPCQVLTMGGRHLMIDCGRCAVNSLHTFGYRVEEIDTVLVTHLHFDHVCDLAHFVLLSWNNGRKNRLRFFGPPGLRDFLEIGIRRAYVLDIESRLGHGKDPLGIEWEVQEFDTDGRPVVGDFGVLSVLTTEHANMPNRNYRFDLHGRRIVITSDTTPDPALAEFSCNADLLVAECSGTQEFLSTVPWGSWHMVPEKLGELARRSHSKHVVLKHLVIEDWCDDPEISKKMAATVRQNYDGQVTVGRDGLKLRLD